MHTTTAAATEPATVSALRQLFGELDKRAALEVAMSDLLRSWGRKSSSEHSKLHVRVLLDLDSELLIPGLARAAMSVKPWLTPGEMWELCMGATQADLAAQEADEAWAWVLQYIGTHGRDGHDSGGNYLGLDDAGGYKVGPTIPAPAIPPATSQVLALIGGSERGGLDRVGLATLAELPFIKKEFATAYARVWRLA